MRNAISHETLTRHTDSIEKVVMKTFFSFDKGVKNTFALSFSSTLPPTVG